MSRHYMQSLGYFSGKTSFDKGLGTVEFMKHVRLSTSVTPFGSGTRSGSESGSGSGSAVGHTPNTTVVSRPARPSFLSPTPMMGLQLQTPTPPLPLPPTPKRKGKEPAPA